MQEVTENVEVAVSNNMYVSVCGNLSVANGFIDFYVTNPSESIILYYKKTSFSCFNFSATENGTYVLHLANIELENDVLATLNYGVNFEIILQATIHPTWHTVAAWQTTLITPTPSIDILEILSIISGIFSLVTLGKALLKLISKLLWWSKYRKSKTPVVFKLLRAQCKKEVMKPKKTWKMAGRKDKSGNRTELTIGLHECCGKTFRSALNTRKI